MKETDMGKLEGKMALITGGTSGIGLATAQQFVHEGAYVFITGRREPELAAAVKEIGSHVTGVHGDVSNLGDLDRLFAHIQREKGRLDIVFANAGVATFAPFGAISVYSATKAAVRSFARTWTTDLQARRIRVNAVSPGPIETPRLHDLVASAGADAQRWQMLANSVPLGRLGTPHEIAKAVVFLASDDSSYITGTELFVDGGMAQV